MASDTPFLQAPQEDIHLPDLLDYFTPVSVLRADKELSAHTDTDHGIMPIYIGGVLYWIVYWYGSADHRTYAKYTAPEAFKAILTGEEVDTVHHYECEAL